MSPTINSLNTKDLVTLPNPDDKFYLNHLVRNLREQSDDARIRNLEILLEQIKVIPSSVMLEKDTGGMCLLHRTLMTFLNFEPSYDNLTEIVKIILIRSDSDYRDYFHLTKDRKLHQKIILELLKKFDRKEKSVTFHLRQILNGEEAKFINLMMTSHENKAPNVAIGIEKNFHHLLQVAFISGSLETLKVLMEYGPQYHDFNHMEIPLLKTVVDALGYVKPENRQKYYECFEYLRNELPMINVIMNC